MLLTLIDADFIIINMTPNAKRGSHESNHNQVIFLCELLWSYPGTNDK